TFVEEYLAGLGIPHLHRVVRSRAGQAFAVRAEGRARLVVASTAFDGEKLLAGRGIPHLHRATPVVLYTRETFAVRAKDHAQDTAGRSTEGAGFRSGGRIPNLHLTQAGRRGLPHAGRG